MSLKLMSVRIPESMHTYLKIKSAKDKVNLQDLVIQAIGDYQSKDIEYKAQLNESVTDALAQLAEVSNGV